MWKRIRREGGDEVSSSFSVGIQQYLYVEGGWEMSAFEIALYILQVIGALLVIANNGYGLYRKIRIVLVKKKEVSRL